MPETVVCWRWKAPNAQPLDRFRFGPETVNTLKNMVKRHYSQPHRFVCVTDDATGLDADVTVVPLWNDFADIPSPHDMLRGRRTVFKNPSCYRRLRMYRADIAETFGTRFVSLDLDTVITKDLSPLWDRPEDIVFWGDTNRHTHYNGSMVLMTAGARPQVWDRFDPRKSPQQAKGAGCYGSDQGWISYCLGPGEAKWSRDDGVYSFRNDIQPTRGPLPSNARMVMYHGKFKPWDRNVQTVYPWVKAHYN